MLPHPVSHGNRCKFSQTYLQRPSSGPQICSHCWQVVVAKRQLYVIETQTGTQSGTPTGWSSLYRQVVSIRRWSLAQDWLYFQSTKKENSENVCVNGMWQLALSLIKTIQSVWRVHSLWPFRLLLLGMPLVLFIPQKNQHTSCLVTMLRLCVCVCVSVCEWEREREREKAQGSN